MHVKATHFHQKSDRKYKLTLQIDSMYGQHFYEMIITLITAFNGNFAWAIRDNVI